MRFLLPHALDDSAARLPEHEAVRCEGQALSYAQLAEHSNRLANYLAEAGVRRGDRVGVYLHKSLESAVAIWGIMKAGAAYVPLDPASPLNRLEYIVQHCGIRHLITSREMRRNLRQLTALRGKLHSLIGLAAEADLPAPAITWDEVNHAPACSVPNLHVIEQDLAYIMYTSGSTGEPKGIMHTHHSGLRYAEWGVHEYQLTRADRIANHAPLHFDISTYDWFGGAIAGSSVVVIPEEVTKLPVSYARLLADEKITVVFTVPFALVQLVLRGALDKHDLRSLRWVIFGGEPFPSKHLRTLMQQIPTARFSNIYGPAEVNGVTFYHVPEAPAEEDEPVSIGDLCPFAQGIIVDEDDQPVAEGESGEFLIRSPSMMQGYWARTDLNQRAFYLRATFPDYHERYYRTGDLVRRLPDGNLQFLGRKDRQIKTRGFRVELDEVESVLMAHDDVEVAAVFPVPDGDGSSTIQAAVILKTGSSLDGAGLTRHAAAKLPAYAVPLKFLFMREFPRTGSDKINRRALQSMAMQVTSGQ